MCTHTKCHQSPDCKIQSTQNKHNFTFWHWLLMQQLILTWMWWLSSWATRVTWKTPEKCRRLRERLSLRHKASSSWRHLRLSHLMWPKPSIQWLGKYIAFSAEKYFSPKSRGKVNWHLWAMARGWWSKVRLTSQTVGPSVGAVPRSALLIV